jgi:hypothetical protein
MSTPEQASKPEIVRPFSLHVDMQELVTRFPPKNNLRILEEINKIRKSKVITIYLAGENLSPLQPNMITPLFEMLQRLGRTEKIDLILRSTGGFAEVPWRIVSLLREYCSSLSVTVPELALSGATHIAIAADELILSELSTLGSVDPTRMHLLLPKDKNQNPIPVSVQDLKHCILFIKEQLGIRRNIGREESRNLSAIISELFKQVHPLAIGAIEQSYQLSRLVTQKVLQTRAQKLAKAQINRIVDKLGAEYFSHSFPICRKDVEQDLGLSVTKLEGPLFDFVWQLHLYYVSEFGKNNVITKANEPPFCFRYIGFMDSLEMRQAFCVVLDPNKNPIANTWVTVQK